MFFLFLPHLHASQGADSWPLYRRTFVASANPPHRPANGPSGQAYPHAGDRLGLVQVLYRALVHHRRNTSSSICLSLLSGEPSRRAKSDEIEIDCKYKSSLPCKAGAQTMCAINHNSLASLLDISNKPFYKDSLTSNDALRSHKEKQVGGIRREEKRIRLRNIQFASH